MTKLRSVLIADPAVILATIFFGLLSLAVSSFDPAGVRQNGIAQWWARFLLWASGVKVKVEGLEYIQPGASYVFVANHLSYMDTPVVLSHVPVQFRFLAKRGLFKIPLLGSHLERAGHIPVPREDPRAAIKTLQVAADVIREKQISLLIFPEGGRSHDGVLRPFKEGGAYIGIKAGVPLVPLTLIGTEKVLPYGSGMVQAGNVTVRIGRPIPTDTYSLKDRAVLTAELRKTIAAQLEAKVVDERDQVGV